MRQRVYGGRFTRLGVVSAVIASFAFALPARAESRRHDGFYAAANVGVGYMTSSASNGFTTPASLWMGGTNGAVALGGGVSTEFAYTRSWLSSAAFFADIYPNPKGGLHIMPSVGWGLLFPNFEARGLVVGVGVGYDYWVGPEVSMGVMARMTCGPLGGDSDFTSYAPALLYTVTYH